MARHLGVIASSTVELLPQFEILSGNSTVTSDATYYYRTFTANATFRIKNTALISDVMLVGGGGGSLYGAQSWWSGQRDTWESQAGLRNTTNGPGGAAGGEVRTYSSKLLYPSAQTGSPSAVFTVTVGAGGSLSSGSATGFATPNAYETYTSASGGTVSGSGYGGANNSYGASSPARGVNSYWAMYQYGYWYTPFFGLGGGGAGAGGTGTPASEGYAYSGGTYPGACGDGGPGLFGIDGIRYGDGAGGTVGGYTADTYNYFGTYYSTEYPAAGVSAGSRGGESAGFSFTNFGTNALANRGGAGGAGYLGSGNGGSGCVVLRYLRSAVGG